VQRWTKQAGASTFTAPVSNTASCCDHSGSGYRIQELFENKIIFNSKYGLLEILIAAAVE
jgi:hypothetical protein